MKKLKIIAASILVMYMLSGTVFAETDTLTYKAKTENGEVTVEEKNLIGEIDNSNLDVNVIKQQGETGFCQRIVDKSESLWYNI